MQISAWRSCPKNSERIQAVSNRNVSRLRGEFPVLEFFLEVLTCRLLPGGAVLID